MIIIDILLFIMTIICVIYCWMLNRRIQDLQNSRIEFARMIKELNASIVKAENNVNEMSELSKVTSVEIKSVIDEAEKISTELTSNNKIAAELLVKFNAHSLSTERDSSEHNETETTYQDILSSKNGEKFTQDDFIPTDDQEENTYKGQLKNFIHNIVSKKPDQQSSNLNQMSYYDTLRKINAKK